MKNKRWLIIFLFIVTSLIISFALPTINLASAPRTDDRSRVDREVLSEIQSNDTASFWINFHNQADLSAAYDMEWSERGWYVYETLTEVALTSQADVVDYLTSNGISHMSFWIKNSIYVPNAGIQTINDLLRFRDVVNIESARDYTIIEPVESGPAPRDPNRAVEPNLSRIKADQVWASGIDGSNLIVANIDSGVRYTHETLIRQYRGNLGGGIFDHNHNWFDPHRLYPDEYDYYDFPADPNGHGTHVMGTSVGDGGGNQIGVAPGADWVACRGCYDNWCKSFALLACGQFILAPTHVDGTNPNPDSRPHVVNNSWGSGGLYNNWYQQVVDNWHAAGIFPVFSNGNSGPTLGNVGNPARYGNVTGVGATTQSTGELAMFSSWGPTDNPDTINPTLGYIFMKPQVVAPGEYIRSALPWSDSSFGYYSGTSMASPHVAGLVALMWQAGPCLVGNYAITENLIEHTALPIEYLDGSPSTGLYPNYATGWGEIDALAAIQAARGYCANSFLSGIVTVESSGASIQNASVEISNSSGYNLRHFTNASGGYLGSVEAGTYNFTVSKYGYYPKTTSGVAVSSGQTVTTNFQLQQRPTISITGTVYDGGVFGGDAHGHPLSAMLSFVASGFSQTIHSNSSTGGYQINLHQGITYSVSVSSNGYDTFIGNFTPDSNPYNMDFFLYVTLPECSARGYGYEGGSILERFERGFLPSGWANIDYIGNGQVWTFNNPAGWPNYAGQGGFADLNSKYYSTRFGPGQTQDAGLRTKAVNLIDATNMDVILRFDTDFDPINYGYETATVRVSRNGGDTWTTVWTEDDDLWFASVMLDLTTYAAGAEAFIVEFKYSGTDGGAWQVDNVHITGGECVPVESSGTEVFLPLIMNNPFNIRPVITAPANGAQLSVVQPTLMWQVNQNLDPGTWFKYWISPSANVSTSNYEFSGWANANAIGKLVIGLEPNKTYYWIAAYDYFTPGVGWRDGPTTAVRSFRTGSANAIPMPVLLSPANGSQVNTLIPTITWQVNQLMVSSNCDLLLTFSTTPTFDEPFNEFGWTGGSSHVLQDNLQANTQYYWYAQYLCWGGSSVWYGYQGPATPVRTLTTGSGYTLPAAPNLIAPANGATVNTNPVTFSWHPVSGAIEYQLRVYYNCGGWLCWFTMTTPNTSISVWWLDPFTEHQWEVRGRSNQAWGHWSVLRTFTTGALSSSSLSELEAATFQKQLEADSVRFVPNKDSSVQIYRESILPEPPNQD